jgi:hypothetical protein
MPRGGCAVGRFKGDALIGENRGKMFKIRATIRRLGRVAVDAFDIVNGIEFFVGIGADRTAD